MPTPTLWTADALANHAFPRAFLIEPIIPRGGTVLFHGKRGTGKSQLALTLAACLTEHGALFGKYPTYMSGPVVYVQADMTAMITQLRVRQMLSSYKLAHCLFHFAEDLDLAKLTMSDKLACEIAAVQPSLIIWDTLRKVQSLPVNQDDVPSFIYKKVQSLFPTATHFFIHHDKKTVVDQEQLEEEELFRGSGAWLDDCDTGIHLTEIAPMNLTLSFTKHRTCEDQPPIHLTLHPETLLLYATAEQIPARTAAWWRERHPQGSPEQLEHYLLSCFVGGPKIARHLAYGGPHR